MEAIIRKEELELYARSGMTFQQTIALLKCSENTVRGFIKKNYPQHREVSGYIKRFGYWQWLVNYLTRPTQTITTPEPKEELPVAPRPSLKEQMGWAKVSPQPPGNPQHMGRVPDGGFGQRHTIRGW